jgi:hypothetical protein
MSFVPAPNVVQINQRATLFGQQIENVHYVELSTSPDAAAIQAVADTALTEWENHMLPVLSVEYVYREAYATDLSSETAPAATAAAAANKTGGLAVSSVPGNVTLCLSIRTNGRGRSSRGRQYISGLPDDIVDGNAWTAQGAAGVVDAFAAYRDALTAAGYSLVVLSRRENNAPRAQGLAQLATSVLVTDLFIDSQRRRLTGRGQ